MSIDTINGWIGNEHGSLDLRGTVVASTVSFLPLYKKKITVVLKLGWDIFAQLLYFSDVPCKIDLLTSVDNLIEPENYINFTQFSLNYITQDRYSYNYNNSNVPQFGGRQTLEDRENSYHAKNQMLHCGFVRGNTSNYNSGFDIDEKDKEIMNNCTVVVSSCIFGNSDFLRRPTKHKVHFHSDCLYCFLVA